MKWCVGSSRRGRAGSERQHSLAHDDVRGGGAGRCGRCGRGRPVSCLVRSTIVRTCRWERGESSSSGGGGGVWKGTEVRYGPWVEQKGGRKLAGLKGGEGLGRDWRGIESVVGQPNLKGLKGVS